MYCKNSLGIPEQRQILLSTLKPYKAVVFFIIPGWLKQRGGHDLINQPGKILQGTCWLATCARKPKVSGSIPDASYVQK